MRTHASLHARARATACTPRTACVHDPGRWTCPCSRQSTHHWRPETPCIKATLVNKLACAQHLALMSGAHMIRDISHDKVLEAYGGSPAAAHCGLSPAQTRTILRNPALHTATLRTLAQPRTTLHNPAQRDTARPSAPSCTALQNSCTTLHFLHNTVQQSLTIWEAPQ